MTELRDSIVVILRTCMCGERINKDDSVVEVHFVAVGGNDPWTFTIGGVAYASLVEKSHNFTHASAQLNLW